MCPQLLRAAGLSGSLLVLSSTFLYAAKTLTIPPFLDQAFFFFSAFGSSLHLPITVCLSRPAALDSVSSDPLTLVSIDLGGCNLLQ